MGSWWKRRPKAREVDFSNDDTLARLEAITLELRSIGATYNERVEQLKREVERLKRERGGNQEANGFTG